MNKNIQPCLYRRNLELAESADMPAQEPSDRRFSIFYGAVPKVLLKDIIQAMSRYANFTRLRAAELAISDVYQRYEYAPSAKAFCFPERDVLEYMAQ